MRKPPPIIRRRDINSIESLTSSIEREPGFINRQSHQAKKKTYLQIGLFSFSQNLLFGKFYCLSG